MLCRKPEINLLVLFCVKLKTLWPVSGSLLFRKPKITSLFKFIALHEAKVFLVHCFTESQRFTYLFLVYALQETKDFISLGLDSGYIRLLPSFKQREELVSILYNTLLNLDRLYRVVSKLFCDSKFNHTLCICLL